jgi:peptide alpha-N-acetyltransferase
VSAEANEESPSTEVFTLHFAAQHFDAKRDYTRALELVQEGIAHTPTLVNLYVAKARILKVRPTTSTEPGSSTA